MILRRVKITLSAVPLKLQLILPPSDSNKSYTLTRSNGEYLLGSKTFRVPGSEGISPWFNSRRFTPTTGSLRVCRSDRLRQSLLQYKSYFITFEERCQ